MSQSFSLGSCFKWIFRFSMLRVSVEILRLFWIYVLLLHTPLGFHTESKVILLTYSKFLVAKLRNQDKKVAVTRVYEDVALVKSSGFINTCHNINIIVQTTGGYGSSLNGKNEIPTKTLANITISIILDSIYKKELWCFAYQYFI